MTPRKQRITKLKDHKGTIVSYQKLSNKSAPLNTGTKLMNTESQGILEITTYGNT